MTWSGPRPKTKENSILNAWLKLALCYDLINTKILNEH